jgi:very-short-patch-repair endonuclease
MKWRSRNRTPEALARARRMRREMSVSERHFWQAVRKRGIGFLCKRQVPVGPYVLDFYFPEASLCVETDGEQHQATVRADARRDEFLRAMGIETIRIPTLDLFEPDGLAFARWLKVVRAECERRAGRAP